MNLLQLKNSIDSSHADCFVSFRILIATELVSTSVSITVRVCGLLALILHCSPLVWVQFLVKETYIIVNTVVYWCDFNSWSKKRIYTHTHTNTRFFDQIC